MTEKKLWTRKNEPNRHFLNSSIVLFFPCQNFDVPLYVHTDGAFSCGDAGVPDTGVASTHAKSKIAIAKYEIQLHEILTFTNPHTLPTLVWLTRTRSADTGHYQTLPTRNTRTGDTGQCPRTAPETMSNTFRTSALGYAYTKNSSKNDTKTTKTRAFRYENAKKR